MLSRRHGAVSRFSRGCGGYSEGPPHTVGRPFEKAIYAGWRCLSGGAPVVRSASGNARCRCPGGSRADDGADPQSRTDHDVSGGRAARKSVGEGKSGSVSVDVGGRRPIKKKNAQQTKKKSKEKV